MFILNGIIPPSHPFPGPNFINKIKIPSMIRNGNISANIHPRKDFSVYWISIIVVPVSEMPISLSELSIGLDVLEIV